jgi:hypothetical protein
MKVNEIMAKENGIAKNNGGAPRVAYRGERRNAIVAKAIEGGEAWRK